ncbi:ABC transporter substrate-binding protein [Dapis sp. BLCC M229]|uniref:ABC transporter substrate-binding protein n=1 Tax=Dapis sp. BLCC M229 TaxID=3400188 RepID=UPI003CE8D07B
MKSVINKRNPYIIGRSIDEPELFFGRESLFRFIEDNLNNNQKVILLHGQRRTGKSSVLQQIPKMVNLGNKFVFILSDFQDKSQWSVYQIIYKLAQEIFEHLEISTNDLASIQDLEQDADKFSQLLNPIFQQLGNRNLVLLLDEFDVLNSNNNDSGFEEFFGYLKRIVFQEKQLFIIPVVGRRLSDMPKLLELFKGAPHLRIGLLDRLSTQRLITRPVMGLLQYNERAINEIIKLSAGHPYFTQAICYALFAQAREKGKGEILASDVDRVIDNAIELSEAGLVWFREGLLIPERVVFSAAAVAQEKARQKMSPPEDPLKLLTTIGVNIEQLRQAQQNLIDNDFLDADGNRVTVEFVRRWFVKYYPLQSQIWELEKLDPEADYYYERANIWKNRGNIDDELYHYRKALELNPNHFSALFRLAEAYRRNQTFPEALELYERAYKINPQRVEEKYIESLLGYGDKFSQNYRLLERNFSLVKRLYERVLEIDPKNTEVLEKLELLKAKEKYINIPVSDDKKSKQIPISLLILTAALAVPLLIGIGIFVGLKLQPVPDYLSGRLDWKQIRERFSSGERTLFDKTINENYNDKFLSCNQKFKNKNYDEAGNCFQELVNANRNEPEPLIYYNNSLARKLDNPLTIAVVVPVDKNSERAKAILRGVAQAQNEHNQSKYFSPTVRSVEIIIANDSNDDKVSPKVAQGIVTNQEILGVIGHNSSNATKAALKVYEKEKLPVISSTSTSTELKSDTFFRTVIDNSVLSKKLAEYVQSLPIEKIVIFYNQQSSFSKIIKEFFEFYLKGLKPSIQVKSIYLKQPFFDINKELRVAADNQVNVGMIFSDLSTIDLAIKIAIANYTLPENQKLRLLGGDTLYNCETLNKGQQAVKGLILAVPWFKKLPTAKPFVDRAIGQWGGEVGWRTATSYDAAKAFIYALSKSGDNPSRSTVLKRLKEVNLQSNETSGQNLRFNPDGETTGQAILVEVFESENPACSNLDFRLVEE